MRTSQIDMCSGPLLKNIIIYTIPILLTNILQLLFNAVDLIVVGRFSGSISVAAVGATGSLIHLITFLFIGLAVGAGVSSANAIGAENNEELKRTIHTAMPAAFVSGAILTVLGVVCTRFFLELMDTPSEVIDLSETYMKIYFCGMISTMVYNFGAAILRAAGDTRKPLVFLAISGVLNVFLNLFFVIVFDMDVTGVAIATVISQIVSAVLVVISLMRRTDGCRFVLSEMHFYKEPLIKIIRIGLPAGIQGSFFAISNVLIQSSINSFGAAAVSGSAAASSLEGFTSMSMSAAHQVALNFIGQNMGAKNYRRISKITFTSLVCVTFVGVVMGGLTFLFGRQLLGIYITDSQQAIEYGLVRMLYISLPYFLCGLMDTTTGILRGMGSSFVPMIITIVGICGIRFLWINTVFQIPEFHTLDGLYLSYTISWIITWIAQMIHYCSIRKKQKRKLRHKYKILSLSVRM